MVNKTKICYGLPYIGVKGFSTNELEAILENSLYQDIHLEGSYSYAHRGIYW